MKLADGKTYNSCTGLKQVVTITIDSKTGKGKLVVDQSEANYTNRECEFKLKPFSAVLLV